MRSILIICLIYSSGCLSHIKWADYESSTERFVVTFSESMVPFVSERRFPLSKLHLGVRGKNVQSHGHVTSIGSSDAEAKISFKKLSGMSSVILESAALPKRAKIDRNTGQYLPSRLEVNNLLLILDGSQKLPEYESSKVLEVRPNDNNSIPGRINKKHSFKMLREGRGIYSAKVFIFEKNSAEYITDYLISKSGVIEFTPKRTGVYILQADELVFSPGTTIAKEISHTHYYASIVFQVSE